MSIDEIAGGAAIAIGLAAYALYFIRIYRGEVRPHAVSWLLWALTTALAAAGQGVEGGGAGSWAAGTSSLACFAIGISALRFGWRIRAVDIVFIAGCCVALTAWCGAKNVGYAIGWLTATDALGYGPTLVKAWEHPRGDLWQTFGLNAAKYVLAIAALQVRTWETSLYPSVLVAMNVAVVFTLAYRRSRTSVEAKVADLTHASSAPSRTRTRFI